MCCQKSEGSYLIAVVCNLTHQVWLWKREGNQKSSKALNSFRRKICELKRSCKTFWPESVKEGLNHTEFRRSEIIPHWPILLIKTLAVMIHWAKSKAVNHNFSNMASVMTCLPLGYQTARLILVDARENKPGVTSLM